LTNVYGYTRGFDTFRDFLSESERQDNLLGELRSFIENHETLFDIAKPINDRLRLLQTHFDEIVTSGRPNVEKTPAAADIDGAALDWLNDGVSEPFFLWLHYMDPHTVFDPADGHLKQFTDRSIPARRRIQLWRWMFDDQEKFRDDPQRLEDLVDLYDATIHEVDESVGRVVDYLRSNGLLENTLVVFTGDHGEEFLDHGDMGHGGYLYDTHLHVPLLVGSADGGPKTSHGTVSHLDVPPTILEAVGIDIPDSFLGTSIWPAIHANAELNRDRIPIQAFRGPRTDVVDFDKGTLRLGFRTDERKFVMNFEGKLATSKGTPELYDLIQDPNETENIAPDCPGEVDEFVTVLESHMHSLRGLEGETDRVATSDAVERRLEDLGYK
jgi:arylsulfatase A-like enzyme